MEDKLKVANGQSGDAEARLLQRCQELQAAMQEKEDIIAQLEQQLEEQVEHLLTNTQRFLPKYLLNSPELLMPGLEFDSGNTW